MLPTSRALIAFATFLALALGPSAAQAAQVCGWLVEANRPDEVHDFALWLQADAEFDLVYQMAGEGIVTESTRSYSPGSGSYTLRAGAAAKPWSFGTTLNPPGDIDIVAELYKPAPLFSEAPRQLIATFTFRRHVPEAETKAPTVFATRQCATVR